MMRINYFYSGGYVGKNNQSDQEQTKMLIYLTYIGV